MKWIGCRHRGFTLTELLVVIVVIAILASLILPALSQAIAKARTVQCLSRQKQWALAFTQYAEDHDGWIAREGYEPYGEVTRNNWSQVLGFALPSGERDSYDVWYNALPPYLPQPRAAEFASPLRRSDFYDRHLLIHCPSARFPSDTALPSYAFAIFSLAMNSQLIQYPHGPTIRLSQIERDPSRTVLFLDNLLDGEKEVDPCQEDGERGQPSAYANRFSARHRDGGNLAFVDGHARWFPGKQVVQTDANDPLRGSMIVPPNDIIWDIDAH